MQGCIPWLDHYRRFLKIIEFAALLTGAIAAGLPVAPCEASTCEQPEIGRELAERMQRDQSRRMKLMQAAQEQGIDIDRFAERFPDSPIIQEVKRIDTDNQQWLAKLIAAHGWPGRTMVGEDGAHAAWLLVQHADKQPEFQK